MITRAFVEKLLIKDNVPQFTPFVELVTWNRVRVQNNEFELSEADVTSLFEYLSEENFFRCDYLTNGIFAVIYNLQERDISIPEDIIDKMFDVDHFNQAMIFFAQTTRETTKTYLKLKWGANFF